MTDLTQARDLLARAGELDAADREAEAAPLYEQAFAAGLNGDDAAPRPDPDPVI